MADREQIDNGSHFSEKWGRWVVGFWEGLGGVLGVNWLMRRQEASMRRGGRQKMGPNRAPATAWIGLRHSSAPPQQQKNTCAKYQVLSKFGTKQEIRQCLFLFCSCSNVFVAPVLKSKRLFCVVRKREGLGSQHWAGGGRVGFQYLFLRNFSWHSCANHKLWQPCLDTETRQNLLAAKFQQQ